jgi:hypothetical protein
MSRKGRSQGGALLSVGAPLGHRRRIGSRREGRDAPNLRLSTTRGPASGIPEAHVGIGKFGVKPGSGKSARLRPHADRTRDLVGKEAKMDQKNKINL